MADNKSKEQAERELAARREAEQRNKELEAEAKSFLSGFALFKAVDKVGEFIDYVQGDIAAVAKAVENVGVDESAGSASGTVSQQPPKADVISRESKKKR